MHVWTCGQELRRNVEVEAAVLMAQRFSGGWVALPPLLYAGRRTLLASWARKNLLPQTLSAPAALLAELRSRIIRDAASAGNAAGAHCTNPWTVWP